MELKKLRVTCKVTEARAVRGREGSWGGSQVVPTPASRPMATAIAACADTVYTGNFIIHWHAHMKPRISP